MSYGESPTAQFTTEDASSAFRSTSSPRLPWNASEWRQVVAKDPAPLVRCGTDGDWSAQGLQLPGAQSANHIVIQGGEAKSWPFALTLLDWNYAYSSDSAFHASGAKSSKSHFFAKLWGIIIIIIIIIVNQTVHLKNRGVNPARDQNYSSEQNAREFWGR